jgi:hypothetical protein
LITEILRPVGAGNIGQVGDPAAVGTRRGDRGIASMALWLMALSTAYGGDLRRARELAEDAVDIAVPLADYHRVGSARSVLAVVCALRGEVEQARDALDPVVRLVDQAGSLPLIPGLARTVGQLHMRDGRPDLAIRWYRSEASWSGEAGSATASPWRPASPWSPLSGRPATWPQPTGFVRPRSPLLARCGCPG